MDPITVPLSKPITHEDKSYASLIFREATVGDLITAETAAMSGQGGTATVAATLALMADVPIMVIKKVSARDFLSISKLTAPLLGNDETNEAGGS